MARQFYQGDIAIVEIEKNFTKKLKFVPLEKEVTIAEGEVTGHKHVLTTIPKAKIEIAKDENGYYLKVKSGFAILTHPTHEKLIIPQGIWFIGQQWEYDEIEERKVLD